MKKYWLYPILLMPLLSNCSPVERTNLEGITLSSITNSQRKVSYRLEDLCKSSNNRKDIILNLYIAKSPETDFGRRHKMHSSRCPRPSQTGETLLAIRCRCPSSTPQFFFSLRSIISSAMPAGTQRPPLGVSYEPC